MAEHPGIDVAPHFLPALRTSSQRCLAQALGGVNLPWAYFDLGKFHLMLREPDKSLFFYAKGADSSTSRFMIESALRSFDQLDAAQAQLPGLDWSREFLKLAATILFPIDDRASPGQRTQSKFRGGPIVIIAGDCSGTASDAHRDLLIEGFEGFHGTIIAGGTRSGIAAVVGKLGELYGEQLQTIGYTPAILPAGKSLDDRYAEQRRTDGKDFSPLEPLRYWADIHASREVTDSIKLVALGGGEISEAECCLAVTFGVPVAIVGDEGEPAKLLSDPVWSSSKLLHRIPAGAEELRGFIES
jgi:hypothetical protein